MYLYLYIIFLFRNLYYALINYLKTLICLTTHTSFLHIYILLFIP